MKDSFRLGLFQAYGIELEYMIVDRDTLNVRPIADQLLQLAAGKITNEFVNGPVTWSNELVMHVIELKCTQPTADLVQLCRDFADNVRRINELLSSFNARLMPGAAHPWMDPLSETQLWPHGNREIYQTYDRIFNCQGHGWSNLQSTHLNLPFANDQEFARLHAAIRILMPIMPALTASSPILNGAVTGLQDTRLNYYQHNQRKIPVLTGRVIPERAFSQSAYQKLIYGPIEEAIAPHDPDQLLEAVWLNSRGAIARFDRGAIEIRILDIQESPVADLALLNLIILTLRLLVEEKLCSWEVQERWEVEPLYAIFQEVVREGEQSRITDQAYLQMLGYTATAATTTSQLWQHLYQTIRDTFPQALVPWQHTLDKALNEGTLSRRLLRHLDQIYSPANLKLVYSELCDCLHENDTFGWGTTVSF